MRYIEPTIENVVACLWRRKVLFAFGVLLTISFAVAAYLATTPKYEASTSLLVGRANSVDNEGGSPISTEIMNSQARIAASGEVARQAIDRIGLDAFPVDPPGPLSGLGGKLREWVSGLTRGSSDTPSPVADPVSPMDVAVMAIGRRMTVATEPNSNVLAISFTDESPRRAAEMANALASSFIDRQTELLARPGVADFFREQTRRFDDEVARRSAALHDFVEREGIYSIEEQRSLVLGRKSELEGALSATRGQLAGKEGEKAAMARQLALLQPVARSPFALGFVGTLSEGDPADPPTTGGPLTSGDTPPLLMIKMFQDVMASFQIADAQIGGLRQIAEQQRREIEHANAELAMLAAKQGEYDRLQRELAAATFNTETFSRRTVEEQIESDLLGAKLSNVRVIQPATIPLRASSPKAALYGGFGLAFGCVVGAALALIREMAGQRRR
ncbi:GumC family protein [Amaricoccus sp. W119]|uniref:GumC family protein n=1 Tax=Amaricoccus sp. W119 TaxID=3391833 RepID=UPI0039A5260B